MISELKLRFSVTIPDPDTETEAYFPNELLSSSLDLRTKKLVFVAERNDRDKVAFLLTLLSSSVQFTGRCSGN